MIDRLLPESMSRASGGSCRKDGRGMVICLSFSCTLATRPAAVAHRGEVPHQAVTIGQWFELGDRAGVDDDPAKHPKRRRPQSGHAEALVPSKSVWEVAYQPECVRLQGRTETTPTWSLESVKVPRQPFVNRSHLDPKFRRCIDGVMRRQPAAVRLVRPNQ